MGILFIYGLFVYYLLYVLFIIAYLFHMFYCVCVFNSVFVVLQMLGYLASWVPSPPGKHTFENLAM
jgi:hypothetical protein